MPRPLTGTRVLDFSRVLAGPHCGNTLLDLGAEVIKLEPPNGDMSRQALPRKGGISGYYAQQAHNEEVLAELGYDPAEIDSLSRRGVRVRDE